MHLEQIILSDITLDLVPREKLCTYLQMRSRAHTVCLTFLSVTAEPPVVKPDPRHEPLSSKRETFQEIKLRRRHFCVNLCLIGPTWSSGSHLLDGIRQ